MTNQKPSQMKPRAPVMMKAACQPHFTAMIGTMSGARIAPTFEPELKMPVASARSRRGNHSATVFTAAGKFAASENPSAARAAAKPNTEPAKACAMPAMLHALSPSA